MEDFLRTDRCGLLADLSEVDFERVPDILLAQGDVAAIELW